MSSQSEVMHCYEQIAPLTERMLMQVRAGQWGELPAQEAQYSDMVDRLRVIEPLESLLESQVARKYQLLSRITSNQAKISSLVMPQLAHLGEVLKSLEQQESLQKTYGQVNDFRL
ncbi:MAG: flagellar protein FliT [Rhodoferax sp.]|nr:flagellar protein FliT [Rhodoferax sp.]